ncbi:alpha/beta hydrolase [Planosporangium thailandense]|uniref:Alpha/beta hydrolase n=1 Tax=Planosporangium thailandense TaxID=765197 RepID=A0ABX0XZM4_9ACTN|nr:alpha/beta hydrolase [Planosporangium thailandense]NJC70655.1 alpha/beta hydrolase [Planosporangium thailandense]
MTEPVRHEAAGPPRGRALALHGLGSGAGCWTPLRTLRRDDLELWTVDLPWSGECAEWAGRRPATAALRDAFEAVEHPVDLVIAHSFGANVLLEMLATDIAAGRDPVDRFGLRGLLLVAPLYRRSRDEFTWDEMPAYLSRFGNAMAEGVRVHSTRRRNRDLQAAMADRVCQRVGPYGWLEFFGTYLRTPMLRTDLLDLPCRVLVGTDDRAAPPNEAAALVAALPTATLCRIADCGHFPMLQRPQDFATEVDRFFRSLGVRSGSAGADTSGRPPYR